MVKSNVSEMALSCHKLGGEYKSPEIKTVVFQPEGLLCVSMFGGFEHECFTFDEDGVEDL